jgi:hypothetical protein
MVTFCLLSKTTPLYHKLNKGEFIIFTQGEYSAYSIMGIFKVLEDADLNLLLEKFHVPESQVYDTDELLSHLLNSGVFEEVKFKEINLDYDLRTHKKVE